MPAFTQVAVFSSILSDCCGPMMPARDPEQPVTKLDRESPARPLADARCGWKS